MNVRWSEHAALEFAETVAYVASEFGSLAAVKMRNAISEAVVRVSQYPNIGKPSFTDTETGIEFRELTCRLNSVIYSIYKDEMYIVSIWSNRQDRAKLYSTLRADAKNM